MNRRHILKILDRTEFSRIPAAEMAEVKAHTETCQNCRAAFRAARMASTLFKESSLAAPPLPTTFFQAKVLEAWRASRSVPPPFAAFWRWWQASATLVSLMCALVFGLMTVSIAVSWADSAISRNTDSGTDLYSAETVILDRQTPRGLTTEQVFEMLDEKQTNASDNEKVR